MVNLYHKLFTARQRVILYYILMSCISYDSDVSGLTPVIGVCFDANARLALDAGFLRNSLSNPCSLVPHGEFCLVFTVWSGVRCYTGFVKSLYVYAQCH